MNKNIIFTKSVYAVCIAMLLAGIYSCEIQEDFEYKKSNSTAQLGVSAWEYIQNTESLSLLAGAIQLTGLQEFYQENTTHTFLAPTNVAFQEYLDANAYASLQEVPVPILRNALKYHIVDAHVNFTNPDLIESNEPIAYETGNGQVMYLSHNSNFVGLVNEGTGNQWEISTSNLEPTNGVLHILNDIVYFSAPSGDLTIPDPSIKTDTLYPLYDAFINGGSQADVNFGNDVLLKIKNVTGDGDYDRKSFLMFDLNDFDEEGIITDLQLELAVKFTHAKGVNLNLYSVQDTLWNEMGLTWNNATIPEGDPVASIITSSTDAFRFDMNDFYQTQNELGKVTFMLDGEAGTDETDELASKENPDFSMPMLIATIASGQNSLAIAANAGFTVEQEGAFAWSQEVLELTGAPAEDIIYSVEQVPAHGWLVKGASILNAGDKFTQNDINLMNLIYINDGTGTSDAVMLSAKDRTGSSVEPFDLTIAIQ